MAYFSINITKLWGWHVIEFPDGKYLPNEMILGELINTPKPDIIVDLLDRYDIGGDLKTAINGLVDPSWKQICKLLVKSTDKSDLALLTYTSYFAYGNYGRISDNSTTLLKLFSDGLIDGLSHHHKSSKLINKVYLLCKETPKLASQWLYSLMVVEYCQTILPHPFQPRLSTVKEIKNGIVDAKELRKICQINNQLINRFSMYLPAITKMIEIEDIIDPTGNILPPIKQSQIDKAWKGFDKKKQPPRPLLCQCLYCWDIRIETVSGNGKTDETCGLPECLSAERGRKEFFINNGF
jgi:hypothetical protein